MSESNLEAVTAYIADQAEHTANFRIRKRFVSYCNAIGSLSTNVISGNNVRHSAALSGRFLGDAFPGPKALGCSVCALRAMGNVQTAGSVSRKQFAFATLRYSAARNQLSELIQTRRVLHYGRRHAVPALMLPRRKGLPPSRSITADERFAS